jgi:hypothetical protein
MDQRGHGDFLYRRIQRKPILLCILIKAYCFLHMPREAEAILHGMLASTIDTPLVAFHILMEMWYDLAKSNSYDNAQSLRRLLERHPKTARKATKKTFDILLRFVTDPPKNEFDYAPDIPDSIDDPRKIKKILGIGLNVPHPWP